MYGGGDAGWPATLGRRMATKSMVLSELHAGVHGMLDQQKRKHMLHACYMLQATCYMLHASMKACGSYVPRGHDKCVHPAMALGLSPVIA